MTPSTIATPTHVCEIEGLLDVIHGVAIAACEQRRGSLSVLHGELEVGPDSLLNTHRSCDHSASPPSARNHLVLLLSNSLRVHGMISGVTRASQPERQARTGSSSGSAFHLASR